ncbi:hypothetical protein GWI33_021724 [Rhynchophorus ferrugineus]|uniref:Uncharacterized protein n=1 Tax=Rhynchophorus ferrugineus TaxID=354439 RepID=A0A834MLL6_RHYFE|nr:hypothetical protein GWI33_021724 [Rhynchophorus ferrugineus]
MWWNILVTFLIIPSAVKTQRRDCSKSQYDRCTRIADPLVKEAHLVFPDNLDDIDLVCRTWNRFVDCLKTYTESCFTDQQRRQFNRAVESPIESVHQMCMQPSYQKEYLQHAPCIKNTIIKRIHCGPHYNLLVDQVEQGDVISKSTLCCSHDRFKQCVQRETRRMCDRGTPDGPASKFATQIIEKALRFLQDQCQNYIPNSGDCSIPQDSSILYSDRADPSSVISTISSSEVYPWSTVQQENTFKETLSSRIPKVSISTSSPWIPSSPSTRGDWENTVVSGSSSQPTQHLGTRTRPASYGRSNTWSTESSSSATLSNTHPMFSDISSTQTNVFREKFATVAAWDVFEGLNKPEILTTRRPDIERRITTTSYNTPPSPLWNPSALPTTETWYPAAGNQLTNEVDEPNQLGLTKPKNHSSAMEQNAMLLLATYLVLSQGIQQMFL